MPLNAAFPNSADMVAAMLPIADKFAAGCLLGKIALARCAEAGDEVLISEIGALLRAVATPDRDDLEQGFCKAIVIGKYWPGRSI